MHLHFDDIGSGIDMGVRYDERAKVDPGSRVLATVVTSKAAPVKTEPIHADRLERKALATHDPKQPSGGADDAKKGPNGAAILVKPKLTNPTIAVNRPVTKKQGAATTAKEAPATEKPATRGVGRTGKVAHGGSKDSAAAQLGHFVSDMVAGFKLLGKQLSGQTVADAKARGSAALKTQADYLREEKAKAAERENLPPAMGMHSPYAVAERMKVDPAFAAKVEAMVEAANKGRAPGDNEHLEDLETERRIAQSRR